jgi:hypothetical protein
MNNYKPGSNMCIISMDLYPFLNETFKDLSPNSRFIVTHEISSLKVQCFA